MRRLLPLLLAALPSCSDRDEARTPAPVAQLETRSPEGSRIALRAYETLINGRRASIPSMLVKAGEVISVAENSRKIARIAGALETLESRSVPQWVEINKEAFEGTVKSLPVREDVTMPIQEQLIVEWYSR